MRQHSFKGILSTLERMLNIHKNDLPKYNDRISMISQELADFNKDLANKKLKVWFELQD